MNPQVNENQRTVTNANKNQSFKGRTSQQLTRLNAMDLEHRKNIKSNQHNLDSVESFINAGTRYTNTKPLQQMDASISLITQNKVHAEMFHNKNFAPTTLLTNYFNVDSQETPEKYEYSRRSVSYTKNRKGCVVHQKMTFAYCLGAEKFRETSSHSGSSTEPNAENVYACDMCKTTFNSKSNLIKHHLLHTIERSFKCDVWEKEFNEKRNLKIHYRIHTGEKPYKCDNCKKEFRMKGHLDRHIVIHTGEKHIKRTGTSCQVIYSQFGFAIHQNDHQARRRFVEWAQNKIAVVPDFHKRILFSDEAHFWLNGYVNKQNCRIWSEANPQVYVETPLYPEKLTVWCALWAGGIIGPYFFKNDEGHNVTVNGDRYRAMITNFFIPELNNHDVQEQWFQQDGATCHTARVTIDLLKDTLGDRLISRFGPVNWPPRSCDLTPLDYFLWGYVKSLVYADKPQTFDHLEDICRVIADIRPQMLEKVIENWTSRLDYIRASNHARNHI
ncbi:zinc finger protein 184 [Trichonephila clavipes]|nr:zinc finger protein 184 [Trichonephila clavipes]